MLAEWLLRMWLPAGAGLIVINELLMALSLLFLFFGGYFIVLCIAVGHREGISGEDYFADGKWLCKRGLFLLLAGMCGLAAWLAGWVIITIGDGLSEFQRLNAESDGDEHE